MSEFRRSWLRAGVLLYGISSAKTNRTTRQDWAEMEWSLWFSAYIVGFIRLTVEVKGTQGLTEHIHQRQVLMPPKILRAECTYYPKVYIVFQKEMQQSCLYAMQLMNMNPVTSNLHKLVTSQPDPDSAYYSDKASCRPRKGTNLIISRM